MVVADDQDLVRIGLRALLESEGDLVVVSEAADGLGAVEQVRAHRPDVVLMDVRMPGIDGIEATRRIAADPSLARHPGDRADDLRGRRLRVRRAAARRQRLSHQGHQARPS
nr:hypothetical protein GCM10020092_030690 [Actinoplanes digitatis]